MRAVTTDMNPSKRSLARAKFRAWWEGEAFDAESFVAVDTADPATPAASDVSADLFDAPRDERLEALQVLWGEGRIFPGHSGLSDKLTLGLSEQAHVALLGPGLYGDVPEFLAAKSVKVLEWRSETLATLVHAAAQSENVSVEPFDLDVTTMPAETFDALISFDEFSYAAAPTRLALQIARTLKPSAKAIIETYTGGPDPDFVSAFASAFAEPQIHQHAAIVHALTEAGLDIEADEDVTAEHVQAARGAFQAFSEKAASLGALPPRQAQELSWETQTWQARLKLMIHGRLQRRRFLVHRRV